MYLYQENQQFPDIIHINLQAVLTNIIYMCYCSKYFPECKLPENIIATTKAKDALLGADFCLHAVPVQVLQNLILNDDHPVLAG